MLRNNINQARDAYNTGYKFCPKTTTNYNNLLFNLQNELSVNSFVFSFHNNECIETNLLKLIKEINAPKYAYKYSIGLEILTTLSTSFAQKQQIIKTKLNKWRNILI